MSNLTPRQERFCQQFIYCLNAAKAARAAGYAPKTANQQGYRLLKDPRITHRIQDIHWTLAEQHGRETAVLIGKLEMVYRRAMEDGRYHAAARAVALQAELTSPGPHRLWRDVLASAAKAVTAAERHKSTTAAMPPSERERPIEAAPPVAGEARLKAVGA